MSVDIHQFPCLSDNYGFLLRDRATGETAAIDTPDAAAIEAALADTGWRLTHIFNTHHHADHAGGNLALKARFGCEIVGPRAEAARIPGLDRPVGDGEEVRLGRTLARVLDAPGHTAGHIVYYLPDDGVAFVGDAIFALGCGRLFEGTPVEMWATLTRIASLPEDTRLYCAHEYTQANARFALSVDGSNTALQRRAADIDEARARGLATVPTSVREERATNPFLRASAPEVKVQIGMPAASDVEAFAELRRRKDRFV